MSFHHQPVMVREVVDLLTLGGMRGGWMVDATMGGGGHAEALLAARPDIRVLGLDRDADAVAAAFGKLGDAGGRFCARHASFREMDGCGEGEHPMGVLMDLGVSSHQLDTPRRGFSFLRDGPLDMRMDRSRGRTAEELVHELGEEELANIFWRHAEERKSRRVAARIVEERKGRRIRTTVELAEIVARAVGGRPGGWRIHPATKTFQALRMEVNDEMGELEAGLEVAWNILAPGGRLAVISFHSVEDRRVKLKFREWAAEGRGGRLLMKKPMEATEEEVTKNARARSAKLRGIERIL